jgi:hypothetical protein
MKCFFCGKIAQFTATLRDLGNCEVAERDLCISCTIKQLAVNPDDLTLEIKNEQRNQN